MNRTHIAGWILAAVLLSAGCAKAGDSTNAAENSGGGKRYRLAVIPKGTTHEFWRAVHGGADDAAKELGVDIIWKGPLREDNREEQIKVVEDFISQGVDGICLAPLDDTALQPAVDNANKAGIPVVIFDSDLKGGGYASFVATDNLKGGKIGGEHLAKLLSGKGRVIMLRYQEGSASTMNREQGFLDAMKENPGITLVSANQYGGATTETAYAASENLLAPLKRADGSLGVDGIFCPNESTTFGMLRALQDGGYAGKVKFVGFDSSPKLIDALGKGEIHGLVLQNPYKMGYTAVKTMIANLAGKTVEKRIDTGAALATPENMKEPETAKLLSPPQK